jgi:hypothetical protein
MYYEFFKIIFETTLCSKTRRKNAEKTASKEPAKYRELLLSEAVQIKKTVH